MTTHVILHSILQGTDLYHNVQTDNLARTKQIKRLFLHLGYEIFNDIRSEGGFHSITFWSFEDRPYTSVPKVIHNNVLNLLKIRRNDIQFQAWNLISTYTDLPLLRRRKSPETSPKRLF
jgi:hypothetical protein